MRPVLSTLAFLFWMSFSVSSGFETNLGSVKELETAEASKIIALPEYSKKLQKKTLPYGQKTTDRYRQALKRKANFKNAKWMDGLNEEGPLDAEEAAFFNSQQKKLVNPNSYESEYNEDLRSPSRWSEYVVEESNKHKGSSHPLEEY